MRRLYIFVIITLLSFSPSAGFSALGQTPEPEYWNGVSLPEAVEDPGQLEEFLVGTRLDPDIGRTRSVSTRLPQGYRVNFDLVDPSNPPQIPALEDAEYMWVFVESVEPGESEEPGYFVLNVLRSPAFVVDPTEGESIHYMDVEGTYDNEFTYTVSDRLVEDENGQTCMDLCTVLPPAEFPPTAENVVAVQLKQGFWIEGLAKNFCLWCLAKGNKGSLLVYPSLKTDQEFSWIEHHNPPTQSALPAGVGLVQGDLTSSDTTAGRMAWAFNPGSGCK